MSSSYYRNFCCVVIAVFLSAAAVAEESKTTPPIQDNSFMVEEAYNQEFGVIQHISTFTRLWNSQDWIYTFTQEWPAPFDERHQLSYTLAAQHAGAYPSSGTGFGDVLLNYRYQLSGSGETRFAFSPRFSLLLASGDATCGRSMGGTGLQTNLPVSLVITPKLVSHWNAGATFVPNARNALGDRGSVAGYNLGQSMVWLAHSRFNVLVETVYSSSQTVISRNQTGWSQYIYVNPGIRWAHNFKNGLQIVPGVGVPVGLGPSLGEKGLFLYLSFEHPYRKIPGK